MCFGEMRLAELSLKQKQFVGWKDIEALVGVSGN
jgi:hypothetical protein